MSDDRSTEQPGARIGMEFYVVRLPDDHPTAPGRYEVDVRGGFGFEQGGRHVAGPLGDFEEANRTALRLEAVERGVYEVVGEYYDQLAVLQGGQEIAGLDSVHLQVAQRSHQVCVVVQVTVGRHQVTGTGSHGGGHHGVITGVSAGRKLAGRRYKQRRITQQGDKLLSTHSLEVCVHDGARHTLSCRAS